MKQNYKLLIIILFSFIFIIKCEKDCSKCTPTDPLNSGSEEELKCSGSECDVDCMWIRIDSTTYTCLSCDDINKGQSPYYSRAIRVNGESYCHKIGITGFKNKKIIYKTKQIVENCKNLGLYEMGDVCYHFNPDEENINIDNIEFKLICKSDYYNHKEIIDGLIYYKCLGEGGWCPSGLKYFDDKTKECFNSCPSGKNKISIIKKEGNEDIYRCTSSCSSTYNKEFTKKSALGETKTYCLENCPEEAKYFYEDDYKCIQNCNTNQNHFFIEQNICKKNLNDCSSKYFLINPKINYYFCQSSTPVNCPDDFPFLFINNGYTYCLTSCEDTQFPFFGNDIITYLYYNEISTNDDKKECLKDKPDGEYYLDEKGKQWVSDCLYSNSGPFHDGEKCVENCGGKYIVEDTNECIEICPECSIKSCPSGYFMDKTIKTCVKECHDYLGRAFYDSNYECLNCGIINGERKGFHKKDQKICLPQCEEGYTFNFNNNICLEGNCLDHDSYPYSSLENDEQKICYNSCLDIDNGEYKFEVNHICYKDTPQNDILEYYYFYKTINGINKYILKTEAINICFNFGLKYLKNSECIPDCGDSEFKVYPTSDRFGLCFSSYEECSVNNYIYFTQNICSDNCDNGYILKDSEGNLVTTQENCLDECPNNYPFEKTDNANEEKICVQKCPNYYIKSGIKKKCQDSCSGYIINENEGHKKCSTQCIKGYNDKGIPIFNYYYKNSENLNICINSCNEIEGNDSFSVEATNEHKSCIDICPNDAPYYDENKQICLKKCDKFYDGNKCLETCNNYIYMENQCKSLCPSDTPFYIEKVENGENKKECVASCVENGYKYFSPENNNKCTNDNPDSKNIYNGGLVSSCKTNLIVDTNSNSLKCKKPDEWNYFSVSGENAQKLDECNEYITTSFECVNKCPFGEHFTYTESNVKYCNSSCGNLYYKKEEEIMDTTTNNVNYIIYKCLESTESICLHIENKKQCLEGDDCGNLYKDGYECKKDCGTGYYEFTAQNKHICKDSCQYYNNKKMCEQECSFSSAKIINDENNKCVEECNKDSEYRFLKLINGKLHCSQNCDNDNKRYLISDYKCISKCPSSTCVKENSNECINLSEWEKNITIQDDEYLCLSECPDGTYFYKNSHFCVPSCFPGDYNIKGTKECVKTCPSDSDNKYFFEIDPNVTTNDPTQDSCVSQCSLTSKEFTRENNHCDNSCDLDPSGDIYYNNDNKICKRHCDSNEKAYGYLCVSSCPSEDSGLNKYEDNDNCIQSCSDSITGNIYNEKDDFKCINRCPNGKFLDINVCLNSCSETINGNIYEYNNLCVPNCPKDKRYFVNDGNSKNKCLEDCPKDFPYYSITRNEDSDTNTVTYLFECKNTCGAYIPNPDSTINALLCLNDKCNGAYQYYIDKNENTIKECYPQCPNNLYYSEERSLGKEDIQCYTDCKTQNLFYFENFYKCLDKSKCKIIDYEAKKCVFSCSENQLIYEDLTNNLIYCLNNCGDIEQEIKKDLFLNYENKCVENCKENYEKKDNENKKCECINLFIIDKSRGIKSCLYKEEETCENQINYPYLLHNIENSEPKQCIDKCDGIISLNGTDCYIDSNYKCPENSEFSPNLKQCICKYKYYYSSSLKKDIVCLPENSTCPRNETFNRELYISETRECVEFCTFEKYTKKYGKTCLELCPIGSVLVNDECFCQDKWYMNSNDEMICVTKCPNDKPIMIDETKQCVETCINTKYPVYYRDKCYLNCSLFPETSEINGNKNESGKFLDYKGYNLYNRYGKYGENICFCKKAWYEDEANYDCDNSDDTSNIVNPCKVFDDIYVYKYTFLPTKECIKECPSEFFSFNEYCFESCDEGNKLLNELSFGFDINTNKKLEDGENNICKCKKLWRYKNDDFSKIECLDGDNCDENSLLIVTTNECYYSSQCNDDNPLLFNKKCYNKTNCPENSKFDEDYPKTCTCKYYYYIDSNEIKCLSENEKCPSEYPNLIYSKDECVTNGDPELTNLVKFNGVYYNYCPFNTKYDSDDNKLCICDYLYGFWYKEGDNYICDKSQCPENKPYFVSYTFECLSKCSLNNYVEYNGICYNECPELTKKNENGVCELESTNESKNITEFTKILTDNIVNLYTGSKSDENENEDEEYGDSKIIELVNSNTTIEFYGVNKNKKEKKEKHNNKNKTSSSLSFIDLSECIEKIYESNNMLPEDDIIILKFDLTNTPKEYLINPVEYKFINSRNGKELDASICGHGAIKISYPFFNIINNYDKLAKAKRNLKSVTIDLKNENDLTTLSEKYNLGKEINSLFSSIDTFNSKNNIYTDFCTAVEINGKDLILEDRMNYLLPHYSLCEKNCSYNHTDFEEERIYCDCSFKTEFDLNREHEAEIDINQNSIIQSQDGKTNFPVLKCISVLEDSKRIKKNIAFYYMLVIIIIEISLLIITLLFGLKSFTLFFNNKICNSNDVNENNNDNNETLEINDKNKDKNNKKYEDEIIKTTQRILNSPPIKKNGEDNKEEYNKENNEIEFIPEEFVFLYFNDNDKGVRKQVDKKEIPFDINKNTKILLQKMDNIDYTNVKASGPFHEKQNLIELIGKTDNNEDTLNINIESINETINENYINEKNQIQNQNKINGNELVTISEEKIYKRDNIKTYIINDYDEIEDNKDIEKDINASKGFLDEMKLEQRLLTKDYDFFVNKNKTGLLNLILTEILDKIYIIKNILFIRKYEIMCLHLSVYVLYHVILLSILAMFYDIKTIKNIWNKENYPGFGLHLGYGILSIIISWFVYIVILCLLTIKGKYNEIIYIINSKKKKKENKVGLIKKKYNSLLTKMKINLIVYYIIQFILIIAFFIYLVTLGAVYSGTMKKIFTSYGITILEVIILKIIYGLILAILRHYSLSNRKNGFYNVVLFFDKYLV